MCSKQGLAVLEIQQALGSRMKMHFPLCSFQSWTHNISKEKEFLRKLVKAKVITDLTYGI